MWQVLSPVDVENVHDDIWFRKGSRNVHDDNQMWQST